MKGISTIEIKNKITELKNRLIEISGLLNNESDPLLVAKLEAEVTSIKQDIKELEQKRKSMRIGARLSRSKDTERSR